MAKVLDVKHVSCLMLKMLDAKIVCSIPGMKCVDCSSQVDVLLVAVGSFVHDM
jgi:hypothetical protein